MVAGVVANTSKARVRLGMATVKSLDEDFNKFPSPAFCVQGSCGTAAPACKLVPFALLMEEQGGACW